MVKPTPARWRSNSPGHVVAAARICRAVIRRIALRLQPGQQFRHVVHRHVRMHHQDEGLPRDQGERDEIRHRVMRELRVDGLHDGVVVGAEEDRVAIRRRALEGRARHRAAGAGDVLRHHRAAEQRAHRLRQDAADDVGDAGDRDGDHQADRAAGEALLRHGPESGGRQAGAASRARRVGMGRVSGSGLPDFARRAPRWGNPRNPR